MTPTFEQAIEIIKALPKNEREKLRDWIEEHQEPVKGNADDEKFRLALQWVDEHRKEYDGKFVVLDGDWLVTSGDDAKAVYEEARAKGYKSPFLKRVKDKEDLPFGGW